VFESIRRCGEQFGVGLKRVFLADGDAMTLSTRRLAAVLAAIRRDLPACGGCRVIACRAICARNRRRSFGNWRNLVCRLSMSGRNRATTKCWRGSIRAKLSRRRARRSKSCKRRDQTLGDDPQRPRRPDVVATACAELAALINAAQPEFLATLVVSFPQGEARLRGNFPDWSRLACWACSRKWSCSFPTWS